MPKNARLHEQEPEDDSDASGPETLRLVPSDEQDGQNLETKEDPVRASEGKFRVLARRSALRVQEHKKEKNAPEQRYAELVAAREESAKQRARQRLASSSESESAAIPNKATGEGRISFAQSAEKRTEELLKQSRGIKKPYDGLWPIILELRNYQFELQEAWTAAQEKNDADAERRANGESGGSSELMEIATAKKKADQALSQLETIARFHGTATANAEKAKTRETAFNRSHQDISHLMALRAELPSLSKDEAKRHRAIADLRAREERLHGELQEMIDTLTVTEKKLPENNALFETISYLLADMKSLRETFEHPEELTDAELFPDEEEAADLTEDADLEEAIDLTDEAALEEPLEAAGTAKRAKTPFAPLPRRLTPEQRAIQEQARALQERVASGKTEDILTAAMDMLPESITSQVHAPQQPANAAETRRIANQAEELTDADLVDIGEEETSGVRLSPQASDGAAEEAVFQTVPVSLAETTAKATRAQHLIQGVQRDLHIPMTYETRERCDNALIALSKIYALLKERQTFLMERPEPSGVPERADARREKDLIAATLFTIEDARHAIHLASNSALTEQRTIPERKQAVRDFEGVKKARIHHVIEEIKDALARAGETDPEAALHRDSKLLGKKPKYEISNATRWALQNELHTIEREFLNRLYGAPGLKKLAARKRLEAPLLRLNANASIFDLWRAANAELERTSPELGKEKAPQRDPWLTRAMDRVQDRATRLVMGEPHAGPPQKDHWLTRAMDAMLDRQPRKKKTPETKPPASEPPRAPHHAEQPKQSDLQPPTVAKIQTHLISQAEAAGLPEAQRFYASLLKRVSGKEIAHEVPRYMATMTQLSQALASGKPELIQHYVHGFEKLHERFAAEHAAPAEGIVLLARAKKTLNDAVAPAYLREDARHRIDLKAALVTQAESAGIRDASSIYDRLTHDTTATKHTELSSEVPSYLAAMTRLALALRKKEELQELERALTAFNAINKRFKAAGFPHLESEDLLKQAKKAAAEPNSATPSRAA